MRVRALVLFAATAVAAGPGPLAAGPRRGKVVRVQRSLPAVATSVRLCSVFDEGKGVCDHAVAVGEVATMLGDDGVEGQAVVRASAAKLDDCGAPVVWDVEVEGTGGSGPPRHGLLVLDLAVEPGARSLPVPVTGLRDGERVLDLLDLDGDGAGDLRINAYPCDHHGAYDRGARPTHNCTDTWLAVRDRWRLARAERAPACAR